jgi:predicted acetyltransferase
MYDRLQPLITEGRREISIYLATLGDEVVGVSKVAYLAGVAGLYWIDTQPEHRGKGIGTATTLAALHDAWKHKYEISILQSSSLGYNLYSRIGFKPYFNYDVYRFAPD